MIRRKHKVPGSSHDDNQPVQYPITVKNPRNGREESAGVCRIEVLCLSDGIPRVWNDDGYGMTTGTPGTGRAQILRNLQLRDEDGDPMWFVREPLKAWDGPKVDGEPCLFQPPEIPVLDDRIRAKMARNRAERDEFLAASRGTAGVVDRSKPVADIGGVIDTTPKKPA
jgi:hypothetical protein